MTKTQDPTPGDDVLIVEDHSFTRRTLRALVESAFPGLPVHEAADGDEALEACARHHPRVVLMDINLPDTDGITLTRKVMNMLPLARVIMVTLCAGSPYVELAHAAGAWGYVVKEKVPAELLPLIGRAIVAGPT